MTELLDHASGAAGSPVRQSAQPARPLLIDRALWVTWEHQRRNAGIADDLGVPLLEIDLKGSRVQRYVRSMWRTLSEFARQRPTLVFAQNPSLVLTLMTLVWGWLTGNRVVIDAHNAAIVPLAAGPWSPLRILCAGAIRLATITLVSNDRLATVVRAAGGRPFVLPDRLPDFGTLPQPVAGPRQTAMFICTYAADEPYREVIEAARLIDPAVTVLVTGNPRGLESGLRSTAPPNVELTGFVPEARYVQLLTSADVVIDLTTRDDCLVCGAYEALSVGTPMVLSGNDVSRSYFSNAAVYTDNSAVDIARAITEALAAGPALRSRAIGLREALEEDWNASLLELIARLNVGRRDRG